ncbi:MAG: septum site-determining protein MinC [Thiofilum sp.]|uniref:septum site-determining protein MinC n=1 Tax=Thiofilum sp. TaxID=2212733 RepID=UPI0025F5303E|nr:septum site-determining protein MinC [Thiofilum sp.]MBK8455063.1 septum site-determining protein MinC [Thiofilum sp.]
MAQQPFIFKGEMTLVNVLALQSSDVAAIGTALKQKREISPVLSRGPIIVDCQGISAECQNIDLKILADVIREADFIPVGLRNFPEEFSEQAAQAGWAMLRPGAVARSTQTSIPVEITPTQALTNPVQSHLVLVDKPVRSGQQVCALQGDIVVLQHTSAGSELLAAGSVHVYGSLRGRVLAGVLGDTQARIFCQKLEAELVAIAGRYRLLDEVDTPLKGRPAMIYLSGEKLVIDSMF